MSTQTSSGPAMHFRRGWIYVLLLALVTINYMDRSALWMPARERGVANVFWSAGGFLGPSGTMTRDVILPEPRAVPA